MFPSACGAVVLGSQSEGQIGVLFFFLTGGCRHREAGVQNCSLWFLSCRGRRAPWMTSASAPGRSRSFRSSTVEGHRTASSSFQSKSLYLLLE